MDKPIEYTVTYKRHRGLLWEYMVEWRRHPALQPGTTVEVIGYSYTKLGARIDVRRHLADPDFTWIRPVEWFGRSDQ